MKREEGQELPSTSCLDRHEKLTLAIYSIQNYLYLRDLRVKSYISNYVYIQTAFIPETNATDD
jgi:hypothetical protein